MVLPAVALLVLISVSNFTARAQTGAYVPIPDSGVVWNFRETTSWCWFSGYTADYSIITDGDTLIGGVRYNKLYTPFVITGNPLCFSDPTGYRGAFRNDTVARKTFYFPPSDTVERLLYDFTWQQGDTVQGWLRSAGISPSVIDRVDSVLVGNDYRRRMHVDCYNVDIIEGVGCTYGLITGLPGCVTDVNDFSLECLSVNGQALLPDTASNCLLINSVELQEHMLPVAFYPVPASGRLYLRPWTPGTFDLQLVDVTGKCIYKNTLELVPGIEAIIETDDLPSGVSALLLADRSSGRVFSSKVVILR
jgi:hypothetical protein